MIIEVKNIKSKIIYEKEDYLKVSNPHKTLRNYLRVRVEGAEFIDNAYFDGYTYFITEKLQEFGTGLLPVILKYCREKLGLTVSIIDKRSNIPTFKTELTTKVTDEFSAEGIYDYQHEAVKTIINKVVDIPFNRGIIKAATNAGKTSLIANLFHNTENPKVLFIVGEQKLFQQTVEFFRKITDVGMIKPKFSKVFDKSFKEEQFRVTDFTVAMEKTLDLRLEGTDRAKYRAMLKNTNILVYDECHQAISKTARRLVSRIDAGCRIYMSGSPFDSGDTVSTMRLIENSGSQIFEITEKDLIEKGVSRSTSINIHLSHTKTNKAIYDLSVAKKVLLYNSKERNEKIFELIQASQGKPVIIAVVTAEHGQAILDYLRSREDYDVATEFVHGGDKDRELKVDEFFNGITKVLISTRILRQGLNMAFLHRIIYAGGGKSGVDLKQWRGRGQRLNKFIDEILIDDFFDIGKYVKKHSVTRLAKYSGEGFELNYNFDLKKVRYL